MSAFKQFPFRDRNPGSGGLDLMFDVCFFHPRGIFEIRQPGTASSP